MPSGSTDVGLVVLALASVFVACTALYANSSPPDHLVSWPFVVVPLMVAAAVLAVAARRPGARSLLRGWWASVAASALTFSVVSAHFWYPVMSDNLLARLQLAFLTVVAIALFVVAIVRSWFRPRDSLLTLAMLGVTAASFGVWDDAIYDAGMKLRVQLVSDRYRAEAAELAANPPSGYRSTNPFLGTVPDRSEVVVGWVWSEAYFDAAWGVAYDPDGLLASDESVDFNYWGRDFRCFPLYGSWYDCGFG